MRPAPFHIEKKHSNYLSHLFFLLTLGFSIFVRAEYIPIERLWPDEALYAWSAQRISEAPSLIFSKEIAGFHPPFYPALLAIGTFFKSPEPAFHIINIILNVLGVCGI